MCVSSLQRVERVLGGGRVEAQDLTGARRAVSLLALTGEPPQPGEWLVVHSGYAIGRADDADAEMAIAELATARDSSLRSPSPLGPLRSRREGEVRP